MKLKSGPKPKSVPDRFWPKVVKGSEGEACWLWVGSTNGIYGTFGMGGHFGGWKYAHRVSYELAYGAIPVGRLVCHRCDNPKCVRPDHLFLGTVSDNIADKVRKGRARGRTTPTERLIHPERRKRVQPNRSM